MLVALVCGSVGALACPLRQGCRAVELSWSELSSSQAQATLCPGAAVTPA